MNIDRPKVSVCIPAYNHERYVQEAIESVLNQTFQDFEILVTDDASTDRTFEIVQGMRDSRIRLFRNPVNMGPSVATNNNTINARGQYVAFLASDDAYLPRKLETQIRFLDQNPEVGVVFGRPIYIDDDGNSLPPEQVPYGSVFDQPNRSRAEWLRYFFFNANCLCGPSAMIRQTLIEKVGLHDPRLLQLQDFDYWIKACIISEIHVLNEQVVKYRIHATQDNLSLGIGADNRTNWEFTRVLWNFRSISDRSFFTEIFPESGQSILDQAISLDFLLAKLALGVKRSPWQIFGLELLHTLLADPSDREVLQKSGFGFPEYFRLTFEADCFNTKELSNISRALAEARHLLSEKDLALEEISNIGRRLTESDAQVDRLKSERDLALEEISNIGRRLTESDAQVDKLKIVVSESNNRLKKLALRLHNVAEQLQKIHTSSFWRVTGIFRGIWRFVENRVLRRNFRFHLIPNNDLEAQEEVSKWISLGYDPNFNLMPEGGRFPCGWVLISTKLRRRTDDLLLKLYFDSGSGLSEKNTIRILVGEAGSVSALVRLPKTVKGLRWDPLEEPGEFEQWPISISQVSVTERYLRHFIRIKGEFLQYLNSVLGNTGRCRAKSVSRIPGEGNYGCLYFTPSDAMDPYEAWLTVNQMTSAREEALRSAVAELPIRPKFSILMPVYNTLGKLLDAAICSVCSQLYDNFELIIVDDASTSPHIPDVLSYWSKRDSRIQISRRIENGNISLATNDAAALASGEWFVFLDHDDLLAPEALATLALHIVDNPDHEIIYSDDDKVDENGRRFAPQFKPDWSPELLLAFSYTSHVKCVSAGLWRKIGGFRVGFEGSQDYDFMLRATELAQGVGHVPQVLYHWRATATSTASSAESKPVSIEAGRMAVEQAFQRRGVHCEIRRPEWAAKANCGIYAPIFNDDGPRVAIVIPTHNGWQVLKRCLDSLQATTYSNTRIVIVDNESDDPDTLEYLRALPFSVWRIPNPAGRFNFAHINNEAVKRINDCELILFLNNDTEVIEPRWLSQMVGWSRLSGVGAVGARLIFPDGSVQHSGIIHGYYHGMAGPAFKLSPSWDKGYLSYAGVTRNYLAVTAACLLTRRQTFLDVGGFDADRFGVAYNDVDYCYRLASLGLRSVCCAEAELYHHEGLSRGFLDDPKETAEFRSKYRISQDPYYNPNLGLENERFPLRPRVVVTKNSSRPVRALLVSHNLNWEGAPNSLFEFACGLRKQGVLDPIVWSPVDGPLRAAWEKEGISVEIIQPPACGSSLGEYERGLDVLAQRLRMHSPEVVYGNTLQTFWVIDVARSIGIPSVWNVRESEPWQTYFDFLPPEIAARALHAFAYPYRVVFVAETTKDAWRPLETRANFVVIRNGLDLVRLRAKANPDRGAARERLGLGESEIGILLLGTVCDRKGQHDLVRAFGALSDNVAVRSRCLIVGDRASSYSRELHAMVEVLPPERRSRITVMPEMETTGDYWSAADIFVCTSRVESYPRVVLEAMAHGLPVISTPCFGVTEQVRPEVNGYFYPAGDHDALARAIEKLVEDNEIRRRFSDNSPNVLASLTSYQEMLDAYGQVFREAALSHPPEMEVR